MSILFNRAALKPGDILHSFSNTFWGRRITKAIGSRGCHDALVCWDRGRFCIGESLTTGGQLTELDTWEQEMLSGLRSVAVLRLPMATRLDCVTASNWFRDHVPGTRYDFWAYPRLLLKCVFGDVFPAAAGKEWAWYCSESVRAAWSRPGFSNNFDVWRKNNPTPRTTEKRLESGLLQDVSETCLTAEGLRHRLLLKGPK